MAFNAGYEVGKEVGCFRFILRTAIISNVSLLTNSRMKTQITVNIPQRHKSHLKLPLMWFFGCLLLAGLCLGFNSFGNHNPSRISSAPAKNTSAVTKPIAEVRVGEWVVATNPAIEDEEDDSLVASDVIRAEEWRKISLRMTKQDGDILRMEFLRPVKWIESHEVVSGGKIGIELGEMREKRRGHCYWRLELKVIACIDTKNCCVE